jgi:hypothetical protein
VHLNYIHKQFLLSSHNHQMLRKVTLFAAQVTRACHSQLPIKSTTKHHTSGAIVDARHVGTHRRGAAGCGATTIWPTTAPTMVAHCVWICWWYCYAPVAPARTGGDEFALPEADGHQSHFSVDGIERENPFFFEGLDGAIGADVAHFAVIGGPQLFGFGHDTGVDDLCIILKANK